MDLGGIRMTDKQRNMPAIRPVTASVIHDAMSGSLEGYVLAVVDSIEFALSRALSRDEQEYVYHTVEGAISRLTRRTDSVEVNHG